MVLLKRFKIRSLMKKIKAMQHHRLNNQVSDDAIAQEKNLYRSLLAIFKSLRGLKKFPHAEIMVRECLRAAAAIDDAEAQYELGLILLEEGKFRSQQEQEKVFASPANAKLMQLAFDEAHAYFQAAQSLGNIMAKRMQGLAYINGWGVDANRVKGFEMVIASINEENSWDKVPEIFAQLGLNKPEFFSALAKHRAR